MLAFDPYASKVLNPARHAPLVANLAGFAADAGVSPQTLCTSMLSKPHTAEEVDYIVNFKRQALIGMSGLLFVGKDPSRDMLDVMSLMAGALTRNFIRARVMVLHELVEYVDELGFPEHTALFVPDFLEEFAGKQSLSRHRMTAVTGTVLHRRTSGVQTILYAPSLEDVKMQYGRLIARHIESHYHIIDANAV